MPLLVYDSSLGRGKSAIPSDMPSVQAHWSQYYRNNPRNSSVQTLSPWLQAHIEACNL